jgi:thiamine transport system ATP-binding protein
MLTVRNLDVTIDARKILDSVNVEVADHEIVGLLGPSGSGKSTLLRAIAGLVRPDAGKVLWDGQDLTDVPTHLRNFGLMFQGFALFPHLSVAENVGFGLASGESDPGVGEALAWVGMAGFGERSVADLSGGEKQRVALARTMAPRPRLVMLDEPLGSLDRNLRERLVTETRDLLKERQTTAIVVTHDRDEAAAIADRLALINEGRVVQTGTLEEIRANPAGPWVSSFLG